MRWTATGSTVWKEWPAFASSSSIRKTTPSPTRSGISTAWLEGTPWEAENHLFEPDYERPGPWLEAAFERVPVIRNLGIKRVIHGAEAVREVPAEARLGRDAQDAAGLGVLKLDAEIGVQRRDPHGGRAENRVQTLEIRAHSGKISLGRVPNLWAL